MKKTLLTILIAGLFVTFGANAADNGFYIEGGVGQSKANLDVPAGFTVDNKDTTSLVGVGYKINKYIAIEGGYRDLGKATASASGTFTGTYKGSPYSATGVISGSADADGLYIGPVFTFPVNPQFEVLARVGLLDWSVKQNLSATGTLTYQGTTYAGGVTASQKDSGTDAYYGIGAAYNVTKNVGMSINYTRFKVLSTDVDTWDVRLKYSF